MKNNEFLLFLKENENVLYIYQRGSSVYEVKSQFSDIDFLVVVNDDFEIPENFLTFVYEIEHINERQICHNLKFKNCDFIFYTITEWFQMIRDNRIEAIECAALKRKFIHKEHVKIPIKIDHVLLRKEISAICSNAWVKGKKKIAQGDYYIGKKSIWHSIRIAMFGIQVAQNKKIINYKEANKYYKNIVLNPCNDWSYYDYTYKGLINNLRTEFRKATESAWTNYIINKNNE